MLQRPIFLEQFSIELPQFYDLLLQVLNHHFLFLISVLQRVEVAVGFARKQFKDLIVLNQDLVPQLNVRVLPLGAALAAQLEVGDFSALGSDQLLNIDVWFRRSQRVEIGVLIVAVARVEFATVVSFRVRVSLDDGRSRSLLEYISVLFLHNC